MSEYYSDLDRIKLAGRKHAFDHMRNGTTEPEEGLFSGEWADGLTGQDALNYAGVEATFSELDDFEQTDVMDAFEDGYTGAPWPSTRKAAHAHLSVGFHSRDPRAEQD